jgi:O-methyltransferase
MDRIETQPTPRIPWIRPKRDRHPRQPISHLVLENFDGAPEVARAYLNLLAECLTRTLFPERWAEAQPPESAVSGRAFGLVSRWLARRNMQIVRTVKYDAGARRAGRDWPADAETMVGLRRLDNLATCVADVVRNEVPGDVIECGAWRGGASIFLEGALLTLGATDRTLWVADSFQGLPPPDTDTYPADAGDENYKHDELVVSVDEVKANFDRYGLLLDNVKFLEGWFKDTLPTAPIEQLAILRLDGDMYEATWQSLTALYPKLSVGGYAIIDDYGYFPGCRKAVEDFRRQEGIAEPIVEIDWTGVYWQRRS